MKKTILLILLLILLGGLAYWMTMQKNTKYDISDRQFAVENIDDVYKVLIVPRNIAPTTLQRKGNSWYINDGYQVRRNAINNLLEVIGTLEMKYIPEKAALKNIKSEMSQIGIKVNAYDKNNKLLKSYYIGGGTADERGTYVMMEGADQPYVTHLRTMEGSVRGRFLLSVDNWRDRTVFRNVTDDIASVKVEYPKDMAHSFSLSRDGEGFQVTKVGSTVSTSSAGDFAKCRAFIEGFDVLAAENMETNNPKRDSITSLVPFSIISYTLQDGDTRTMKLFPLLSEEESEELGKTLKSSEKIARYFVDCSWGEFVLVQHRLIRKLLRGYGYFVS